MTNIKYETNGYSCALCHNDLPKNPIIESQHGFCCIGCQTVFNVLTFKNQLTNYQEHPLFKQAVRSGLISNPVLLEQIKKKCPEESEDEYEKIHLEIQEMWCPSCAEIIKLFLLQHKGIRNCVIDYSTELASIEFSPRFISKKFIYSFISSLGYQPHSLEDPTRKAISFHLYLRFIIAAFCSLNVMMFAYPLYAIYFDETPAEYGIFFGWLSLMISLPVLFYSSWPIFKRFLNSLRVGLFGMETLVVLGVSASFALSLHHLIMGSSKVYFDSMTVIILFMLLGKIFESKAKFSAKESILRLSRSLPRKGRKRLSDGTQVLAPVKEIKQGDIVLVFSGEKIVLDGLVVEGSGSCDESLMTGESLPVRKKIGSKLLGGAILQEGSLAFKVTAGVDESALNKIIRLVEEEIGQKTVYIRSADKIVQWFVPGVILIAIITALYCLFVGKIDGNQTVLETALIRAISIVLISCPCAIGIAAPLAESQLIAGLAQMGAIVRNRGCLPLLGNASIFIFDKTGTLTEGKFEVLKGLEKLSLDELKILKTLTTQSNHLISLAIAKTLHREVEIIPFLSVQEHIGRGITTIYGGKRYSLGSRSFMEQFGAIVPIDGREYEGISSSVFFACDQKVITTIKLGDRVKEEAPELIKSLSPRKSILLSGDSEEAVQAVANYCGLDEWFHSYSPLQKKEFVDNLRKKGELICMLGDGINDAPALTGANVSISVVSATDMSIQVSDILLTTDSLSVISKMENLAKKGQRIIKQNLFWAFFYNVVGIFLAVLGILSPIFSAFAMTVSSLIVLFNAKRISRY